MNLREKIQADFKDAFKDKNGIKLSVLKMLQAEIRNSEIAKRTKLAKSGLPVEELEEKSRLTDEEILQVVSREIKKRKKAIELYEIGNRKDLADKEKMEIEILLAYEN